MRAQITVYIILSIVLLLALGGTVTLRNKLAESALDAALLQVYSKPERISVVPRFTCVDSTPFETCSAHQPLFCTATGVLAEECRKCGCSSGGRCSAGGTCVRKTKGGSFRVIFVPLNYASADIEFRERVQQIQDSLVESTALTKEEFEIYPSRINFDTSRCVQGHEPLQQIVREIGSSLVVEIRNGLPVFHYRIIGIDKNVQNEQSCGCAFTYVLSPLIYVGGHACSREPHVILHELGHTFGLCDEYDTCVWEQTDKELRKKGQGCKNARPTTQTSNCGIKCCAENSACCAGTYATPDQKTYNVMGSADNPPARALSPKTAEVMNNWLCDNADIC